MTRELQHPGDEHASFVIAPNILFSDPMTSLCQTCHTRSGAGFLWVDVFCSFVEVLVILTFVEVLAIFTFVEVLVILTFVEVLAIFTFVEILVILTFVKE